MTAGCQSCQFLSQAKDGKDAIVTGGPYALLRHSVIFVKIQMKLCERYDFDWQL